MKRERQPGRIFLRVVLHLAVLFALGACSPASEAATTVSAQPEDGPWVMPSRALCAASYAVVPSESGRMSSDVLAEVSGLVASPAQPGVLWAHNDSGDAARIYGIDERANLLAIVDLAGIEAIDFEDIAAAACPDGSGPCIWVADVGDNREIRDDAVVYAVPEPSLDEIENVGTPLQLSVAEGWRFPVVYPGGAVNVEALVVRPDGSEFYLFEKSDSIQARLFRTPSPLVDDVPLALENILTIESPGVDVEHGRKITGADLHPSGQALLVRVYTGVFEFALDNVDDLQRLHHKTPAMVALGPFAEPQGEAIAYDDSGLGIWTMSEDPEGRGLQPLHFLACQ